MAANKTEYCYLESDQSELDIMQRVVKLGSFI